MGFLLAQLHFTMSQKIKEEKLEEEITNLKAQNNKLLSDYAKTKLDDIEKQTFPKLQEAIIAFRAERQKTMILATANKTKEAHAYYQDYVLPYVSTINNLSNQLIEYNSQRAKTLNKLSNADFNFASKMLIIVPLFYILSSLGLAFLVSQKIAQPLQALAAYLTEIAKGNLSIKRLAVNFALGHKPHNSLQPHRRS